MKLKPAFIKNNIPVVLLSNENYAKYMAVTIKSIVINSSESNNYDIIILDGGLSSESKRKIKADNLKENISIRFIDMIDYTKDFDISIFKTQFYFTIDTYYRLFIPKILELYNKAVFIDSDTVVNEDIANLYNTNLNNNLLAAVVDISAMYIASTNFNNFKDYLLDTLKMNNIENYIQAGVMVFNINKMNEFGIFEKLIEKLKEIGQPWFLDQCIMSAVCEGQVLFLDAKWNVEWVFADERYPNKDTTKIPEKFRKMYFESLKNPSIIHYCGSLKPWIKPEFTLANKFWEYAKKTSFYEEIIFSGVIQNIKLSNRK